LVHSSSACKCHLEILAYSSSLCGRILGKSNSICSIDHSQCHGRVGPILTSGWDPHIAVGQSTELGADIFRNVLTDFQMDSLPSLDGIVDSTDRGGKRNGSNRLVLVRTVGAKLAPNPHLALSQSSSALGRSSYIFDSGRKDFNAVVSNKAVDFRQPFLVILHGQ